MKRFVCFLLTLVMIVSIVPATVLTASAASNLEISDKAIEILKQFEGFQAEPYKHGSEWYIGYGTRITEAQKNQYIDGITKTEATTLLKDHIHPDNDASNVTVDEAINNLAKRHNLAFTQYQHDALALFSYNCGTAWMSGGAFLDAVVNGKRGNDFLNAIALYNTGSASSDYFRGLMNRRLAEANMFLNNMYSTSAPANYTYVVLDLDGGVCKDAFNNNLVVYAYDTSTAPAIPLKPTKSGSTFLGWTVNTQTDSSKAPVMAPITVLDASASKKTIVATWQIGNTEMSTKYDVNTSECASLIVYKDHDVNGTVKGTLKENSKFSVTKEYVDANGVKWIYGKGTGTDGKTLTGWVGLKNMNDEETSVDTVLATGTVTTTLNVRDAATTAGNKLGELKKGDIVQILAYKNEYTAAGTASWGKIKYAGGTAWINLAYVTMRQASDSDNTSLVGKTATVVNAASVNIRANAGTEYADINDIKEGTKVTILETKKNATTGKLWAKIRWDGVKEGWIYTYYLKAEGAGSGDLGGIGGDVVLYTGVVTSNTNLNVRSTPKISYTNLVGSIPKGTKINIYEKTTVNNVEWGRTDNGWVCLLYVSLTATGNSDAGSSTGNHILKKNVGTINAASLSLRQEATNNSKELATLLKGDQVTILEEKTESTSTGSKLWGKVTVNGVTGYINLAYVDIQEVTDVIPDTGVTGGTSTSGKAAVVSGTAKVNVRAEASVRSALVKTLTNGTKVTVYKQIESENAPWCETDQGWICGYYLTMTGETSTGNGGNSNTNTNPDGTINGTTPGVISATGIVNSNTDLNVRAGAGLGFAKVGALKKGTQVTIYEQKFADNMTWGKTNSGWVCMSYITINSTTDSGKGVMGTIARCFNAVNVRSGPGTGYAQVGTILVGTRVEIFSQKLVGDQYWGQVAQGWICMQYVALDGEMPPEATEPGATQPTEPETTNPDATNSNPSVSFSFTGTVNADVNVRKDATSLSDKAGTLNSGMTVNITALKSNTTDAGVYEIWGRTDDYGTPGWVNLAYVNISIGPRYTQFDNVTVYNIASTSGEDLGLLRVNAPVVFTELALEGTTVFGKFDMQDYVDYFAGPVGGLVGWVQINKTGAQMVNVAPTHKMSAGGGLFNGKTYGDVTAYTDVTATAEVFKFYPGSQVSVYETKADHGIVWGKVFAEDYKGNSVEGWIDVSRVMFQVVRSVAAPDGLNVRKVAGATTDDSIMGQLTNGTTVYITSLMMSDDGVLWGQIQTSDTLNGGWINMDYTA